MNTTRLLLPLLATASVFAAGCSGGDPSSDPAGTTGETEQQLTSADKAAFDFFLSKGLSNVQAAGIVGNLDQESGMNPSISQYGGGPGRGIAQWSAGGRWDSDYRDNAVWFASHEGKSAYSLGLQLDFIWYELQTFSGYGLSRLRASHDVASATVAFQNDFEGCGQCDQSARISFAERALNAYGHGGGGGSASGGGGGASAGPGNCSVHADHRLYCNDNGGAAMYRSEHFGSGVVNHLRSSFSWFKCWGTGDRHGGGNTTWYYTLGDDNGHWGYVPAVDLQTASSFDANPSAHGLPRCQ